AFFCREHDGERTLPKIPRYDLYRHTLRDEAHDRSRIGGAERHRAVADGLGRDRRSFAFKNFEIDAGFLENALVEPVVPDRVIPTIDPVEAQCRLVSRRSG